MVLGVNEHRPRRRRPRRVGNLAHDRAGCRLRSAHAWRRGEGRRAWYSRIQWLALSMMKRRTMAEPGPSRLTPRPHGRDVPIGEVLAVERRQIRALGSEVVVDDVEHDRRGRAGAPRRRAAQIVGPAVCARRRVQADAVVSPVAHAGEICDRHQLDRRDAEIAQGFEPAPWRRRTCLRVRTCRRAARRRSRSTAGRRRPAGVRPRERGRDRSTCEGPCTPSGWNREAGSGRSSPSLIRYA